MTLPINFKGTKIGFQGFKQSPCKYPKSGVTGNAHPGFSPCRKWTTFCCSKASQLPMVVLLTAGLHIMRKMYATGKAPEHHLDISAIYKATERADPEYVGDKQVQRST